MDTIDYWDGLNKESIGKLIKMINSKNDEHKVVVFDEKLVLELIDVIDKVDKLFVIKARTDLVKQLLLS